jgi:osmoprotectant transport system permease protein
VIQTIPSLALLAVMVFVLAALGALSVAWLGFELRSIGYLPAIVALTLYSLLPILRNTVSGIEGVDPALREAALGLSMTDREQLLRVELPLALPVVVANVRTAAVWIVGTTTLSTPVGATSLGNFIFSGLQTRNAAAVLVGCAAAALLAIALDQLIRGLELGLRQGAGGVAWVWQRSAPASRARSAEPRRRPAGRDRRKTFTGSTCSPRCWRRIAADGAPGAHAALGSTVSSTRCARGHRPLRRLSGTLWATVTARAPRSARVRGGRHFLRAAPDRGRRRAPFERLRARCAPPRHLPHRQLAALPRLESAATTSGSSAPSGAPCSRPTASPSAPRARWTRR